MKNHRRCAIEITNAVAAIYRENLRIKNHERVLVFTDKVTAREDVEPVDYERRQRLRDVAMLVAEVGRPLVKEITYHEFAATGSHAAEPPERLWQLALGEKAVEKLEKEKVLWPIRYKKATAEDLSRAEEIVAEHKEEAVDAIIALSNYSTSHTRFRDLLTRVAGTRYASMPLFDASMLEGAMQVDWKKLKQRTAAVAKLLRAARTVEISTPNGSHLTFEKGNRKIIADDGDLHKAGSFGNLPAGEVYCAPVEGTGEGKLVLDWAPTRKLESQLILTIENGLVTKVEGDEPFGDILRKKFSERKENTNLAELGIGTNERAQRPDNILETEKILGTIHIAFGDNSSFGGKTHAPFHQDYIFFRPTVTLKDKEGHPTKLLKDGKLLVEEE